MNVYDKRICIEEVNRGYLLTVEYMEEAGELTLSRRRRIVFEDLDEAVSQVKTELSYK